MLSIPIKNHENEKCSVDVAFFLPNLEAGGAENSIIALANGLAFDGKNVVLVLGNAKGPFLVKVSPQVRVENLNIKKNTLLGKLSTIFRLASYLKSNQPNAIMSALDVPNVQLVLAARLARFRGLVVISQRATVRAAYQICGFFHRRAYFELMRICYPLADMVICNSSATADEVCALFKLSRSHVISILNSVNIEKVEHLSNVELSDRWVFQQNTPLIVSVGSVTPLKDRSTLIRAFALVNKQRPSRLAIVGPFHEPEEQIKITSLISELGLSEQVRLTGFDPNPYRWMKRAAVLVSSSLTEGCPNQLLEALSLNIPIVATDCPGGTSEVLQNGKWGRLVPIKSTHLMADAIVAAIDDSGRPDGRLRAAEFSPYKVLLAYQRVLMGSRLQC